MATPHRSYHALFTSLGQVSGRPQRTKAAHELQLWKLAVQQKTICLWVAFFVLMVCFTFAPIFSSHSSSAEEQQYLGSPPSTNFAPIVFSDNHSTEEQQLKTRPASVSPSIISTPIFSPDSSRDHSAGEQHLQETARPSISPSISQEIITPPLNPGSDVTKLIDFSVGGCNIWRGEWIPHPDGPGYTNVSCPFIQENQDCIKLGRPDLGFLYWRWKPRDCELPLFDAKAFFKVVAGKRMVFVGDSLARNHYQSVLCSLAQVEMPKSMTFDDDANGKVHWHFQSYNFTLTVAWAPFLVKGIEDAKHTANLYLDVVDESWGPSLHNYDYIVLSGGRWFYRPGLYYVQDKLMGCNDCPTLTNVTDVGFSYAYKAAVRTVFDYLISSKYKGVVFFRTFLPEHWQNGAWNEGGNCTQIAPIESKSTSLSGFSEVMYKMQLEEFGKALQRSSEFSFTLKIVDALHAALLRPDAHPGPYGHFHSSVQNDCLHWCLPGAVDTWSAMLLHVLKHL